MKRGRHSRSDLTVSLDLAQISSCSLKSRLLVLLAKLLELIFEMVDSLVVEAALLTLCLLKNQSDNLNHLALHREALAVRQV